MHYKDQIKIERKDGYSTFGQFKEMDEDFVYVICTLGDNKGKEVAVPKENISQITVTRQFRAY